MKAVIYARVSTDMQNYEGQLFTLRTWAEGRGWPVGEIYAETESAWKDGHQKELARLIADSQRGRFDIVLVWALDRLSRGGSLPTLELWHTLKRRGVRIYSHEENWTEYPGEFDDIMLAFTGWVASMESRRRAARTKEGIARKRRENGGAWGRRPGVKDSKKRKRRAA